MVVILQNRLDNRWRLFWFLITAQNWWVIMFGALERPEDVAGVLIIHKKF